jgi:two-component system, cell cycle sensor histidine kinase and response regulator CckA
MRWIGSYAKSVRRSHLLTMHRHNTILLVEAENDVRLLMAVALRRLGHSVIEAQTATDACAKFGDAGGTVALLLTEVSLPDGTGPDLYRLLVAVDRRLRLLLTSGHAESALIRLVAHGPATDFILKPFSLDALVEKVGDTLRVPIDIAPAPLRSRTQAACSAR